MTDIKKARPGAGTPGQAAETAACGRAAVSKDNFNINPNGRQSFVVAGCLRHGRANAIASKDLARLLGVTTVRKLQQQIASERAAGALILSTCEGGGGHYLPSEGEVGRQEIRRYVATLRARAKNTFRACESAEAALAQVEGQVAIYD